MFSLAEIYRRMTARDLSAGWLCGWCLRRVGPGRYSDFCSAECKAKAKERQ